MKRSKNWNPISDLRSHLSKVDNCRSHPPLRKPSSIEEAEMWFDTCQRCSPEARREHLRWLCLHDLFFLSVFILHRWHFLGDKAAFEPNEASNLREARHADRDERKANWCWERCREYEADPWNHLDIWAREHFKTEVITFAANIQSILKDPNETIGLFSHTRPIAKGFLRQLKSEFENNTDLKDDLFPDIFYTDPRHQAPHWGDDVGIFVKRISNRKEATVEAWGLIDGQPISKRFTILSYDDVVSRKEISEYMVPVATQEFRNSLFLTASDPVRFRYCATFQEVNDTTQQLMEAGMKARIRPAVDSQQKALCLSDEKMAWFNNNLTPKEIALQLLMDPKKAQGDHQLGFRQEWVQYYERNQTSINSLNKYIFVDPSGATQSHSRSHYSLNVIGLSPDGRYKWLDAVYDKLNLDGRTKALKDAVTLWHPLRVFYEKQAMQSDIEHIRGEMRRELWECEIVEVGTNQMTKDQRIEMLLPVFSTGLFQMPKEGISYVLQSSEVAQELKIPEGAEINVVKVFLEQEYARWPFGVLKDILDAMSWLKWAPIQNLLVWPRRYGDASMRTGEYGIGDNTGGGWMCQ